LGIGPNVGAVVGINARGVVGSLELATRSIVLDVNSTQFAAHAESATGGVWVLRDDSTRWDSGVAVGRLEAPTGIAALTGTGCST